MFPIELLGDKTNPAKSARNLGVIFDQNFTFRSHISVVCNSCFYHIGLRIFGVFVVTLIWRVLNYSLLLSCPVVLIIVNHCVKKQPIYLHSMLAASIPSRSLRSNNDNSLSVPRVKTNTGARACHSCARLFGTTSHCLSVQPVQLLPSKNI